MDITDQIEALYEQFASRKAERVEKLPQSGSSRIYFRIYDGDKTFIATYNRNVVENETFIAFSNHFKNRKLPVPTVFILDASKMVYIQEDLGNRSLLDELESKGHCKEVYDLYKKSLQQLVRFQIEGDKGLDYSLCLTASEFGKEAILSDLLYFKYYFLDSLEQPYDKQALLNDFEALAVYLRQCRFKFFMFRDFQSRNIIVENGEVYFIDYQGGMKGAMQYDAASLLWQARAQLSDTWKEKLLNDYIDAVIEYLPNEVDRTLFTNQYKGFVLIRLLQVLGAYGFRGLFERKAQFLSSIPLALRNLKWFVENRLMGIDLPEFDRMLRLIVSDKVIQQFETIKASDKTPLRVEVNSFSYRKSIPVDKSTNGGGFVFDCRGILNPGRFDEYKKLCGKDKPVQDFLEQKTKMNVFLNSVFDLIDISVENYLERGFEHLQINFGCTGGQHRSVYAAEQTARHLRNKYNLHVQAIHTNQENWVK
ncbi:MULTISPECIES: RapZ C-terminal domain-containing protein [Chitinophagaceae]